jgi:OOP family OmpA-OmpF porin
MLLTAIAVPLIVAAVAVTRRRDHIQGDLTSRAQQGLSAAGFPSARISFDGRDATVENVPAGAVDAAKTAVLRVRGVRAATVSANAPAPSSPVPPLRVAVSGRTMTLSGAVPNRTAGAAIIRAATSAAPGRTVVDHLAVTPGASAPATPAVASRLVAVLGTGDRGLSFDGRTITLTGAVADDATKTAIERRARAAMPAATIDNRLSVTAVHPDAGTRLQAQVDAMLGAQPVMFQPDSASLTPAGLASVQTIAALLRSTTRLRLEVDGHVARTAGNRPEPRTLSRQRADAVAALLAQLGVRADITAKGFGDSRPLATDSTPEGQAKNRRVEIKVL